MTEHYVNNLHYTIKKDWILAEREQGKTSFFRLEVGREVSPCIRFRHDRYYFSKQRRELVIAIA